jgi:hypothetical protein
MAGNQFRPTHRTPAPLTVWSSPGPERTTVGGVNAGAELVVDHSFGDWVRVHNRDGFGGWVPASNLVRIGHVTQSRWFIALAIAAIAALVAGGVVLALQAHRPHFSSSSGSPGAQPQQQQPTAGQLINDAYDNGRIDRATYLRYSVYSMFGVDALPSQYRGSGPDRDGMGIVAELTAGDPIAPDLRAELLSFIGRPTDPGSVFYGAGVARTGLQRGSTTARLMAASCNGGVWTSEAGAPGHYFKVWTKCTSGYESRLASTVSAMDDLWTRETKLMGNPIPDIDPSASDPAAYGGDGYIDIYLIPRDTNITRKNGTSLQISGLAGAVTVATPPYVERRSSGYMLMDEAKANDASFPAVLAHEFFHVLENAHNQKAQFDRVRLHYEENWYTEASAVWAETYFERPRAILDVYINQAFNFLSHTTLPIDSHGEEGTPEWYHGYQDYLWLYFMEQEQGPGAIASAWGGPMFDATNGTDGTKAFEIAFPFSSHFGDFALRNLDAPSLKQAIGKTYQVLDSLFPPRQLDAVPPEPPRSGSLFVQPQAASAAPASTLALSVEHLTANYYDVTFNSEVDQVTFDLTSLASSPHVEANLIVEPLSSSPVPTLLRLPLNDPTMKLCDVKKVERAILVVSNGDMSKAAAGKVLAKGTTDSCSTQLSITSVSPNHVIDGTSTTVVIKGSGFANLLHPDVILSTPSGGFADINGKNVRLVNDTEIDVSGTFSAPGGYAFFDVTVFEGPGPLNSSIPQAVCSGCLNIDAGP